MHKPEIGDRIRSIETGEVSTVASMNGDFFSHRSDTTGAIGVGCCVGFEDQFTMAYKTIVSINDCDSFAVIGYHDTMMWKTICSKIDDGTVSLPLPCSVDWQFGITADYSMCHITRDEHDGELCIVDTARHVIMKPITNS